VFNGVELTTGQRASTEMPGTLAFTAAEAIEVIQFDFK